MQPVEDASEFLEQVTKAPIPAAELRALEDGWCLHRGFGACCDSAAFHLPGVWTRVRQHPALYRIAALLMGQTALWVDINRCGVLIGSPRQSACRSIQKLPKQGEKEFLHWDLNPFATGRAEGADAEGAAGEADRQLPNGLAGKVCYTRSQFVCVLGSHTWEFHENFQEMYKEFYPDVKPTATKFGLDPKKGDPLGLFDRQRSYEVPPGCVIFWHPKLLHGQTKTPRDAPIEYGCYLGYFPAHSRDEYKEKCGSEELHDRIRSYCDGVAPHLWPSTDKICFYPKRFMNFPKILQGYVDKMPPGHPSIQTRTTGNGQVVPHLVPIIDSDYVPPELSELGRKLLGLDLWDPRDVRDVPAAPAAPPAIGAMRRPVQNARMARLGDAGQEAVHLHVPAAPANVSPVVADCTICMDDTEAARFALMPCGHSGLCSQCVRKVMADARGCPFCRAGVTDSLRLF